MDISRGFLFRHNNTPYSRKEVNPQTYLENLRTIFGSPHICWIFYTDTLTSLELVGTPALTFCIQVVIKTSPIMKDIYVTSNQKGENNEI